MLNLKECYWCDNNWGNKLAEEFLIDGVKYLLNYRVVTWQLLIDYANMYYRGKIVKRSIVLNMPWVFSFIAKVL